MDFVKNMTGSGNQEGQQAQTGGQGEGIMGKLNNMGGGGAQGRRTRMLSTKVNLPDNIPQGIHPYSQLVSLSALTGVDFVQQRMGGGDQSNEGAGEQFKDEQISDAIRSQYKGATGKEFPVADK